MRKIILDCDPGHDDAVALILAGQKKYFDLLAVTTTSGNQTIEKTTKNAINLCEFLKIDVPVARGLSKPLVKESQVCGEIHGESGLDGYTFPIYNKKPLDISSVQLIIDLTLKYDKVTIVITGPMTNVALALTLKPEIKEHIEEIIFMGGSTTSGNVSPAAEFNILVDPEAAHIVLSSGLKIKMVGLNITRQVLVSKEVISRMKKIGNKTSDLFVKLMNVFNANQAKTFNNFIGGPLHDPVTIASLIDDKLLEFQLMNVEIDLSHGPSYGRTNCDVPNYLHRPQNCYVAMNIDVDRFWDIIEEGIRYYE